MTCQHRDHCRDVILNGIVCISHLVKQALTVLGRQDQGRVISSLGQWEFVIRRKARKTESPIPPLKEIGYYSHRMERAIDECKDAKVRPDK